MGPTKPQKLVLVVRIGQTFIISTLVLLMWDLKTPLHTQDWTIVDIVGYSYNVLRKP